MKQHIAIKHLETVYSCDICDTSHKKALDNKEHTSLMHPKDKHLITTYCGECQTESTNDLAYRHIMKMHRSFYIDENGHIRRRYRTSKYGGLAAIVSYNLLKLQLRKRIGSLKCEEDVEHLNCIAENEDNELDAELM